MTGEHAGATDTELSARALTALAQVLRESGQELAGALRASLIAGGRSNLTYRLTDGQTSWVLRTPPRLGRTPSAHDVLREFRVTTGLSRAGVPVPRPVAASTDDDVLALPYAIAEFVDGTTIQSRDQLAQVSDQVLDGVSRTLVETLAALHSVDYAAVGLGDFGRPDSYFGRQLRRWSGQWELVGDHRLAALATEAIDRLRAAVPEQRRSSVVHGDYRIDNTILHLDGSGPRVAAIVDWELSTIGDPVADVATMAAYRHPAFDLIVGVESAWTSPRMPGPEALASMYESVGGDLGSGWAAHLRLAHFKIAVIAAGIAHRAQAGGMTGPGFDTSGEAVEPFLEAALAVS